MAQTPFHALWLILGAWQNLVWNRLRQRLQRDYYIAAVVDQPEIWPCIATVGREIRGHNDIIISIFILH